MGYLCLETFLSVHKNDENINQQLKMYHEQGTATRIKILSFESVAVCSCLDLLSMYNKKFVPSIYIIFLLPWLSKLETLGAMICKLDHPFEYFSLLSPLKGCYCIGASFFKASFPNTTNNYFIYQD